MKSSNRVLAALLLCLPSLGLAKAVSLKAEWPMGQKLVYVTEVKTKQDMAMPQMSMKSETNSSQGLSLEAREKLPDGSTKIGMEFLSFKMSMTGMMPLAFDSASDPAQDAGNPLSVLRAMVGAKFTFTLKPDGSVSDFQGAQELAQKLASRTQAGTGMDQVMSQFTNEGSLRRAGPFMQVPVGPVNPGQSWPANETYKMGQMGGISVKLKNTFTGTEMRDGQEVAVISSEGTLSMTMDMGKAGKDAPKGVSMKVKDGKVAGKNYFDLKNHRLQETHSVTDMVMEMTMPAGAGPNGAPGSMTMTMNIDQVTKLKP